MRIVIDLQGAQTASRFRGIGRYSLSLAQAMARNRGGHEVILALSGLFPDTLAPIREAFSGLLPREAVRVWRAPGPVRECNPENAWRRETAELAREAFLASLRPDVLHVSSLFEGFGDDAAVSIGRLDTRSRVSVSLYDLIPMVNPGHYLDTRPLYASSYRNKAAQLARASLFLAISEHTRREAIELLGLDPARVVNVSAAIEPHFRKQEYSEATARLFLDKFKVEREFILYTGGADERKNLPRLIQALGLLPAPLRRARQLVLAGKLSRNELDALRQGCATAGLARDEVVFTGYVTEEELVFLYNRCALFILPSWHEGFGLPVLEAMACGAPVICAGTSSLPEVAGLEEAYFDPLDPASMAAKLEQALGDGAFRERLRENSARRAGMFSWDACGRAALAAFEELDRARPARPRPQAGSERPRLAFVSPLPPARSGIAGYSADLLPALARHYDLVLVSDRDTDDPRLREFGPVRDPAWLAANAGDVDRVVYQFGNSPFHTSMLDLLEQVPGVVVLHDFFLSGLLGHLETTGGRPLAWTRELYRSHGYGAVRERWGQNGFERAKVRYPSNHFVLDRAEGVIVHSHFSQELAREWYGPDQARDWAVIPLVRTPCPTGDRLAARAALGLDPGDFVVCSFGFLDPSKLNHRLLAAWRASALNWDPRCRLAFVGENHGGDYGRGILEAAGACAHPGAVQVTGWADDRTYRLYLEAADVAVQLRTLTRGETSAAALDCLNHGLATIVNANGALADLPAEAVWRLPDEFEDQELAQALETLWRDAGRRQALGAQARAMIESRHAPAACATAYHAAIEAFHEAREAALPGLVRAVAALPHPTPQAEERRQLAWALAQNLPETPPRRRLFLDITATHDGDLKTGIERAARALVLAMIEDPPAGFRAEPVRLDGSGGRWRYRYARRYTLELLGCPGEALADEEMEPAPGDVLLGLDISGQSLVEASASGLFARLRDAGTRAYFVVYDLLPLALPHCFPQGTDAAHAKWLEAVTSLDGAACISQAVAVDLANWIAEKRPRTSPAFRTTWFHLSGDIMDSAPTLGLAPDGPEILARLRASASFLMVGTIEPRKGHLQVLDAFDLLWSQGGDQVLVIVGRPGWRALPPAQRRTIPEIEQRLSTHPELGKRLVWLPGISDEYLEQVYAACSCLLAASEGEGFGLPLLEAAGRGLPILARDIPVFREVAGEHAAYFHGGDGQALASAIKAWLAASARGETPSPAGLPRRTWSQSARMLLAGVLPGDDGREP